MAGVAPAMHGPLPKRSGTRLGHVNTSEQNGDHITKAAAAEKVAVPHVNPEWDPMAKRWFKSLAKSGQSVFYEPSDWAYAYFLADQISEYQRNSRGRSSMMLSSILSGMTSLLTTEGDRRRARIELEKAKPPEKSASVVAIETYKSQLKRASSGGSVETT